MNPALSSFGANVRSSCTDFCVYAPQAHRVSVILESPGRQGESHIMSRHADGIHRVCLDGTGDGVLYRYQIDNQGPFPDPASRFQPQGVHGPSQVVDWRKFVWSDHHWTGLPFEDAIIYELHVGTFTSEGTFAAAQAQLPYLKDLGITAIELMPVGDFPGQRNWGYDVASPFAPARCYGTTHDLRRLIDHAHGLNLAVYLDVIYNHLGPDGAYQSAFNPFFYSSAHRSPWGAGINFDGPKCEPVRSYVIQNALQWIHEYHFDGLRLDATHAIVDQSPRHIVAALAAAVADSLPSPPRIVSLIAEDERNLTTLLQSQSQGGWGVDAVWADDFHHQMRRCLAGDSDGYFADFDGHIDDIAATARQGWFYTGQYAPHFGAARGSDPTGIPPSRFVFCLQNHDQIGNRAFGERLHHQIDEASWRAASALLLLLPETPLLFMGQEWAASTPFLFFTDHSAELGKLVTEGRRREFGRFAAFADPAVRETIPDPQNPDTFARSRLDWSELARGPHAAVLRLYRQLISLRKTLSSQEAATRIIPLSESTLLLTRSASGGSTLAAIICLRGGGPVAVPRPNARFSTCEVLFTTEDPEFALQPRPTAVNIETLEIRFARPGAVILRWQQPTYGADQ